MSCGRLSLLTNVTCAPRTTVTFRIDSPLLVMLIVAPPVLPPGFGVGEVVLSPSQAGIVNTPATASARKAARMW